jgi:hypothetical protein
VRAHAQDRTHSPGAAHAQIRTADISWAIRWRLNCSTADMIWFLEKQDDLLVCEIRRAADNGTSYEFEIADSKGPTTHRFDSASELIAKYLQEHSRLIALGWRPRAGDIEALE